MRDLLLELDGVALSWYRKKIEMCVIMYEASVREGSLGGSDRGDAGDTGEPGRDKDGG